jgi:CheY-like chemotaxis protein
VNILLVEDSPEVSLSVREILASAGHDVDDAANGKEALAKLAEHSYDSERHLDARNGRYLSPERNTWRWQ